ncbi:MAG: amino acid permease [Gammaproteobacteria bacterium]|nr:amino acid permease [Gammaproteobacteria bacterium]
MPLRRQLGLSAVLAIVVGDMIGSGIFFTPGELAAVASSEWQVYFFWALCGVITLCGALTLAELATLLPQAGVSYHALTQAYGPFAGFMQAWIMILVSGPGAIAGIAVLFGEFATRLTGGESEGMQLVWAAAAIVFFALINLRGVQWGGRIQVVLTAVKVLGLLALVAGGLIFAEPHAGFADAAETEQGGLLGMLRFVGLGVAIVLFTYDGWIDASNVAGEVKDPGRNFPLAMGVGVILITAVYLLVNFAFLRVVPLDEMRSAPTQVAATVATAAYGNGGGTALNLLMWISIFGALGGLIMTLPRLFYAAASEYVERARETVLSGPVRALAAVSGARAVPSGAILIAAGLSIAALLFFGSFSRIVTFFVVPFQLINILMVSSVFVLRPRLSGPGAFRVPGYPFTPAVFMLVMSSFLLAAVVYNPFDSMIGIALTLTGIPVYRMLVRNSKEPGDDSL